MSEESKPGNNGSDPVKTPEELEREKVEAKKKRFEENPDNFIEINEIIAAAIRSPVGLGVSVYVAPAKRSEYDIAYTELNLRIMNVLMTMDKEQWLKQQEAKDRIISPHHPRIRDIFKRR